MAGTILAVVDDLIFLSKIQQTAKLLGVSGLKEAISLTTCGLTRVGPDTTR